MELSGCEHVLPFEKGKTDPKGDIDIIRTEYPSTDLEDTGPGASVLKDEISLSQSSGAGELRQQGCLLSYASDVPTHGAWRQSISPTTVTVTR